MGRKKWELVPYDKERAAELSELTGEDPFAVLLALSRGYDTPEALCDFFHAGSLPLSSPFLLKDMEKGVARIRRAIGSGERILVYGDYDADGVTATALLYSYLQNVGADVDFYIPSRLGDGYGLTGRTAERILQGGFSLVVTVDNGIAAVEEAAFFKENGIDLVVTDHHRAGDVLPDCAAVIDPHRPDDTSPCKELAGVGVALKLAAALEDGNYGPVLEDYLDIVTLGTVADIVPLTGENRTLVTLGLPALESTCRPGLTCLMESLSLADKSINSTTVAFALAPKINAAGRMDTAETALELLLTEDFNRASELVASLHNANTERQTAENRILEEAAAMIEADPAYRNEAVTVVAGKNWHPGVIGIVASRLVETYGKPAFVISVPETGEAKGSCRSIPGFSLYEALSSVQHLLTKFGGHTLAAGFSVYEENIPALRDSLNALAGQCGELTPVLSVDCRLNPANLSVSVLESLALLEPFGASNPGPVFGLFGVTVTGVKPIGNNRHVRLSLVKQGVSLTAVRFGQSVEEFPYRAGDTVDLAVKLEKNEYMGQASLRIQVRDIRPAGANDELLFPGLAALRRAVNGGSLTDEEKRLLLPGRELIKQVYAYIKNEPGAPADAELLALRAGLPPEKAPACAAAAEALTGLGLLSNENGALYTVPGARADLHNSALLQTLGYAG